MDVLKALLVHPDAEVRDTLRRQLAESDIVRIVGGAATPQEALELMEFVPYGVLFCATELDDSMDGFELAGMLAGRRPKPAMVFIAPDESLAYRAFELQALDYLIWPCDTERLAGTLDRLRSFRAVFREVPPPEPYSEEIEPILENGAEETVKVPLEEEEQDRFLDALRNAWDLSRRDPRIELDKLAVTSDGRTILIPYSQIVFFEAYEDYSYVHTVSQKYLTSYRLKNMEERLKPHRFFRVHRKYLVNLDMVTEIASLPGSNFMLRTSGKTRIELPVGRRRVAELKQILGL